MISAICDTVESNAVKLAKSSGINKTYQNFDEMLEKEELDFIDVCSPGFTHFGICEKAMKRNVNCLIEKPVTTTSSDLAKLLELERQTSTKNSVIQSLRYTPPVLSLMDNIRKGRLGMIKQVTTVNHSLSLFTEPEWYRNESLSGGMIFESGVHFADLQCLVCGVPERIIGLNAAADPKFGFTTAFQVIIRYESGIIGILDISANWSSAYSKFDVYGTAMDVHLGFYPFVYWESGSFMALLNETAAYNKRLLNFGRKLMFQRKKYYMEYHLPIISKYIEYLSGEDDNPVPLSSTANTLSLLEMIRTQCHRMQINN